MSHREEQCQEVEALESIFADELESKHISFFSVIYEYKNKLDFKI